MKNRTKKVKVSPSWQTQRVKVPTSHGLTFIPFFHLPHHMVNSASVSVPCLKLKRPWNLGCLTLQSHLKLSPGLVECDECDEYGYNDTLVTLHPALRKEHNWCIGATTVDHQLDIRFKSHLVIVALFAFGLQRILVMGRYLLVMEVDLVFGNERKESHLTLPCLTSN